MFRAKKIISFVAILFLTISPFSSILADGCLIPPDYQDGDVYEPSQTALIVHDEGIEDLYLRVNYEGDSSDFVWLVPTPTYPTTATSAPDIFKELSALTTTVEWIAPNDTDTLKAEGQAVNADVIVHDQKNVGIYEVTVLSAIGTDSLFDWLNSNGYKLKDEVKEVLSWYVEKEWYFTAMRITPDNKMNNFREAFKKIDNSATDENVVEKFSQYYIDAFMYRNYENFLNVLTVMGILMPEEYEEMKEEVDSMEDFLLLIGKEDLDNYSEMDWLELKNELKSTINEELLPEENGSVYKYSDYIEPIKISFKTEELVYPLKISQVSTRVPNSNYELVKTNEVLLYILSNEEVVAPEFVSEYAKKINISELAEAEKSMYSIDFDSIKEIVGERQMFLTKMRRDFAKVEMDEDLYFLAGKNSERAEKIEIKIFTGNGCPYCEEAVSFLNKLESNHKDYLFLTEYEVYENEENKIIYDQVMEERDIKASGVPIIIIEDEYIVGFDSEEITGLKIKNITDKYILKLLSESYLDNINFRAVKDNIKGSAMSDRLKGKILIKVEDEGKAYYINPTTHYSHYLGRPIDAFKVMREQGVGITNENLEKIPVAIGSLSGDDSDADGLSDLFEDAIGTDKNKKDSDGDGYEDKAEIVANYNPNGSGELYTDNNFSSTHKGKIFLQIESSGEAWYVNPEDGKRYFLGRPDDAFNAMRSLGLGISNKDFDEL